MHCVAIWVSPLLLKFLFWICIKASIKCFNASLYYICEFGFPHIEVVMFSGLCQCVKGPCCLFPLCYFFTLFIFLFRFIISYDGMKGKNAWYFTAGFLLCKNTLKNVKKWSFFKEDFFISFCIREWKISCLTSEHIKTHSTVLILDFFFWMYLNSECAHFI